MNNLDQYYQVYGSYPQQTIESQRHYKEFCKLLEQYSLDDLVQSLQSPITRITPQIGIKHCHYEIEAVTDDLIVSHLMLIHEKWNIPIPEVGWWSKGIRAQAKEMIRDYSKQDLHYYMHKLESDSWYRKHITEPFTFAMVRKYIERSINNE